MPYPRFEDPVYLAAKQTLARGNAALPGATPALTALSALLEKATAGTSDVSTPAEGYSNGIFLESARTEMAARAAAVEALLTQTHTGGSGAGGILDFPIVGPIIGDISSAFGVSPVVVAVGGVIVVLWLTGVLGGEASRRRS